MARASMALGGLAIGAISLAVSCTAGGASQEPVHAVVAMIRGGMEVVRVDPATGAERRLFTVDSTVGWLERITVSPSGMHVGVVEVTRGIVRGNEYERLPRNRLVILDTAGRVVDVMDRDVRRYSWCCEGGKIAAVVGRLYEGAEGFLPEGVYLRDVTRRTDTLLGFPRRTTDLHWARFDSALYARIPPAGDSATVWRYEPATGAVRPTAYTDFRFSPSGRYYLVYNWQDESRRIGWHLLERETGREVALPDTSLGAIEGWVYDRGDYLLLVAGELALPPPTPSRRQAVTAELRDRRYAIYDVRTGAVVERGAGGPAPDIAASSSVVPILRDGRIDAIPYPRP